MEQQRIKILYQPLKAKWYRMIEGKIMEEEWKDVKGYEGLYQISNLGRVKRLANTCSCKKERFLKPHIGTTGYPQVILSKKGKTKTWKIHRLVAFAFLPNPQGLKEISHIDEDSLNPCLWNLKWCTSKENCNMPLHKERLSKSLTGLKNSETTKLKKRQAQLGEKSHRYGKVGRLTKNSMSVNQFSKEGIFLANFESYKLAEKATGIASSHIGDCCWGKRKTAGGFIWKFANVAIKHGREEWGAEKGKKYLVEVLGRRTTLDGTKLWED